MMRRRRWERVEEKKGRRSEIALGDARINFDSHEVTRSGEDLKLTRLELDLLRYFTENPGRVISRDELLEQVWKLRNYSTARTVDNFISRLRKHFEAEPSAPRHFLSIRGAGYKFVP